MSPLNYAPVHLRLILWRNTVTVFSMWLLSNDSFSNLRDSVVKLWKRWGPSNLRSINVRISLPNDILPFDFSFFHFLYTSKQVLKGICLVLLHHVLDHYLWNGILYGWEYSLPHTNTPFIVAHGRSSVGAIACITIKKNRSPRWTRTLMNSFVAWDAVILRAIINTRVIEIITI